MLKAVFGPARTTLAAGLTTSHIPRKAQGMVFQLAALVPGTQQIPGGSVKLMMAYGLVRVFYDTLHRDLLDKAPRMLLSPTRSSRLHFWFHGGLGSKYSCSNRSTGGKTWVPPDCDQDSNLLKFVNIGCPGKKR